MSMRKKGLNYCNCFNPLKMKNIMKNYLKVEDFEDLWKGTLKLYTAHLDTIWGNITMYAANEADTSETRYRIEVPWGACGEVAVFKINRDDNVTVTMINPRDWRYYPDKNNIRFLKKIIRASGVDIK